MTSAICLAILNVSEQKAPSRMFLLSPHNSLQLDKGLPCSLSRDLNKHGSKTSYTSPYDVQSRTRVFFTESWVLRILTLSFSERNVVPKASVLERFCRYRPPVDPRLTWGGAPLPGDRKHSSVGVCLQVQVCWGRQC